MSRGTVLDLFCGGGGASLGMHWLGYDVIGIDLDANACAIHAANGFDTIRADATTYPAERFRGKVLGCWFSPVCTPFSRAGKRGMLDDPLGPLVWEPLRWTEAIDPEWIVCEQVPDVLPIWRVIRDRLAEQGYSGWCGLIDFATLGVPQNRTRAVLMASKVRAVQPPEPTHGPTEMEPGMFGPGITRWPSMAEALGWGMTARPGMTVAVGQNRTNDGLGGSGARATVERERESIFGALDRP